MYSYVPMRAHNVYPIGPCACLYTPSSPFYIPSYPIT